MLNLRIFILAVLGLLAACSQQGPDKNSKERLRTAVRSLKDSLGEAESQQKARKHATKLARKAGTYTDTYPDDTLTPEYLYLLGDVHFRYLQNAETALSCLKELQQKYPDHQKAPFALFTQGFFYEQLSNNQKAKQQYQKFLKKYPDHKLSEDVRLSIKSLGKSPKQQLKEALEKRGKQDSLQ